MQTFLVRVFVVCLCAASLAPLSAFAQTQTPALPITGSGSAPYEKDLLRLAEILGSLHYLRPLCNEPDGMEWRKQMQALLDSESEPQERRNLLAGAFNAGYSAFQKTYNRCTESAHIVMRRYLSEGARLSRTLTERYGH